jgi:NAD(P)-dependent dehydrogenase (short-subunit alcohol dehydrogenase family)
VTGGGSGIGRAVARELLRGGFRVVVAGRRPEPLDAAVAGWSEDAAIAIATDVTDSAAVKELFEQVVTRFGRVDVLFNNAGIFDPPTAIDDYPVDAWRSLIDTNLTGAFLCAQAAFRVMRRQAPAGGRIINNGSLSSHAPRPNAVAYTASKHAITGLTKALALEGRPHQIACGQIDIGNAATDITVDTGTELKEPTIDAGHVARAVRYMADLPLEANVLTMTVMATGMPFVGRG